MLMTRHPSALGFTLWGLLGLWAFFGGLVLAEQFELIPETAPADEAGTPDLDAEALVALGSGLKPNVPSVEHSSDDELAPTIPEFDFPVPSLHVHQPKQLTPYHSVIRPIYQRLSIYRI